MAAAPPTGPAVKPSSQPPSPLLAAWPRSAQWTTAFLLGIVVTVLAGQGFTYLRRGSRPTELERAGVPAYRIDLNHASREELLQLPGVGDHMATRIEDFRKERGKIRRVDELTQVHGVGQATLNRLRDWVRVDDEDLADDDGMDPLPPRQDGRHKASNSAKASTSKKVKPVGLLDINTATVDQLVQSKASALSRPNASLKNGGKSPLHRLTTCSAFPRLKGKTLDKIRPFVIVSPPREVASNRGP